MHVLNWFSEHDVRIPTAIRRALIKLPSQALVLKTHLSESTGFVQWTLKIVAPSGSLTRIRSYSQHAGVIKKHSEWLYCSSWTALADAIQVWHEVSSWNGHGLHRIEIGLGASPHEDSIYLYGAAVVVSRKSEELYKAFRYAVDTCKS